MAKLDSLFPGTIKAERGKGRPAEPPARTFIQDFQPGQEVEDVFLVQEASLRAAKNGSRYVQAGFADRSGQIAVRQWDASEKDFALYKPAGFLRARGRVETYQNKPQFIVFNVRPVEASEVRAEDFLAVSKRDPAEMERELDGLLAAVADPDYKLLLQSIFGDALVREAFLKGPAASNLHHAWIGGLLEHVLSAAQTAQSVAAQRPFLNRDLLLTGVILHDIGKIEELDPGPGFAYTDTGRLCGHIALGTLLVDRFIRNLKDFPKKKRDLLLHMILSHHGERDLGSPVTPCTGEAVALHHIECLDAKVQGMNTVLEREAATGAQGAWSDFSKLVDGKIYRG
jgi:3'-5' exoribonuclease